MTVAASLRKFLYEGSHESMRRSSSSASLLGLFSIRLGELRVCTPRSCSKSSVLVLSTCKAPKEARSKCAYVLYSPLGIPIIPVAPTLMFSSDPGLCCTGQILADTEISSGKMGKERDLVAWDGGIEDGSGGLE